MQSLFKRGASRICTKESLIWYAVQMLPGLILITGRNDLHCLIMVVISNIVT